MVSNPLIYITAGPYLGKETVLTAGHFCSYWLSLNKLPVRDRSVAKAVCHDTLAAEGPLSLEIYRNFVQEELPDKEHLDIVIITLHSGSRRNGAVMLPGILQAIRNHFDWAFLKDVTFLFPTVNLPLSDAQAYKTIRDLMDYVKAIYFLDVSFTKPCDAYLTSRASIYKESLQDYFGRHRTLNSYRTHKQPPALKRYLATLRINTPHASYESIERVAGVDKHTLIAFIKKENEGIILDRRHGIDIEDMENADEIIQKIEELKNAPLSD